MYKGLLKGRKRKEGHKYEDEETDDQLSTPRPRSRRASLVESMYESTVISLGEEKKEKRKEISDYHWNMERKKIGFSKSSKNVKLANLVLDRKSLSAVKFIQTHFNRKECVQYVHQDTEYNANLPRDQPCYCGAEESDHKIEAKETLIKQSRPYFQEETNENCV